MSTQFNCQKTFLFQAIQFSQTVLIQSIQFSSSIVLGHIQLNVKTVLFQNIQFGINTQFSSIWPIDKTLSGATNPGQSGSGSDFNEGVLAFPKAPASQEPHHQIVLCHEVLRLCRGAVGVF